MRRMWLFIVAWTLTCALSPVARSSQPTIKAATTYAFLNDPLDEAFTFRCIVAASAPATAYFLVNFQDERSHYRIELTPATLNVNEVRGGQARRLAQAQKFYEGVTPTPAPVVVKRRGARMAVVYRGRTLITLSTETWRGGKIGYGPTDGSVTFSEVRYQPVEPVHFADDFMRAANEPGQWNPVEGAWNLQSIGDPRLAANSFFYVGRGAPKAIAAAGHWFWDNYTLRASVRPRGSRAVGLCVYLQDKDNYFLFRWDAHHKELIKVFQGNLILIARMAGGFEPNQWYRLTFSAEDDTVRAAIDGVPIFESREQMLFGQGKIGLYSEGEEASDFDDVLVTPADETDADNTAAQFTQQFTQEGTMEGWANPKGEWVPVPNAPGAFWHRGSFFGDHTLQLRLNNVGAAKASLTAFLNGDGSSLLSGYALRLESDDGKNATARLLRQGRPAASAESLPLTPGQPLSVRMERHGQQILIAVAGRPLWRFLDRAPLSGRRVGYQAQGWTVAFNDAEVKTPQVYDYTFYRAPTDWRVASGTWDVASRWTCSPGWSWFGGWSRELAAVWNKREFAGDVVVQMFVAPRMDPQDAYQRAGNLCITLCGDGRDVNSGYNLVFAGDHNKVTRILRGNKVVQETPKVLLPNPFINAGHRRWFNVTAEKIGNTVSLYVDYQLALRVTDPQPLPGHRVALWTHNSGMMLARVTIYYDREVAPTSPTSWVRRGTTSPAPSLPGRGTIATPLLAQEGLGEVHSAQNFPKTQNPKPKTQNPKLPPSAPPPPPLVYSRGLYQLQAVYFQDEDQGAFQDIQLNKPVFWKTFGKPVGARAEEKIEFDWGAGKAPLPAMRATYWSVQFTAKLYVSEEGDYTFYVDRLDDGARLRIDGKVVVDAWNVQPASSHTSQPVHLTKGFHILHLDYCQGDREASVILAWSSPTLPKEVISKGAGRVVAKGQ